MEHTSHPRHRVADSHVAPDVPLDQLYVPAHFKQVLAAPRREGVEDAHIVPIRQQAVDGMRAVMFTVLGGRRSRRRVEAV
jgi:hypothetical protein